MGLSQRLSPKLFLLLTVLLIVLTRLGAISGSRSTGDTHIDLSIYREVGELVVNGIDPYDVTSRLAERDALRQNNTGAVPWVAETRERYDHYVGANLPASTALYGLLEYLTGDEPRLWRFALIAGDISIALAAFFFLRRAGVALDSLAQQATFSLAVVYYPSLIQWGTIGPEDKQFQTALMLLLAGHLIGKPWSTGADYLKASAIGVVGIVSVLFKAVGIFLLPVGLRYFYRRPPAEFLVALLAGLFVTLPFLFLFDMTFISNILGRAASGSAPPGANGIHGSPWALIPGSLPAVIRPLSCAGLLLLSCVAYLKGKIDLLNLCAAASVIFLCLWIVTGSMDRMNIAMMFALMCLATISRAAWHGLTLFNFVAQLVIYIPVFARARWLAHFDIETPDAIATLIFLISYFGVLFFLIPAPPGSLVPRRPAQEMTLTP